jgi:hypothetical protein
MTTSKSGRRYKLTFQIDTATGAANAIEIRNPLTLEFDIVRNTSSSINTATFRVYNLSEKNRSLIFQNRTSINDISGNRKRVELQAGYNTTLNRDSDLATIFTGDLLEAYSFRQGPNVITYINALDGATSAYNSSINKTLDKGITLKEVASELASSLVGIKKGVIGNIEGEAKTAVSLNGNAFYLLSKDYKDEVFIDLGKVNILNRNEYLKTLGLSVPLITSETGLLGTPQRQGTDVVVDMLFEPKINVAQLVEIKAQINKEFDGQYKVMGVKHSGIISDAVNGDCRTTLNLYIGDKLLGGLKGV